MEAGKQTSALELFDRALRSNANEPLALYGKGILLADEQITEEIALSMLRQAAQQSGLAEKYRVRAYLRMAEIYAARKEKDEAMQNLSRITGSARLADGLNVRRQAGIYLILKEKDRAREVTTAFLEAHPEDEETEYFLLRLYAITMKDLKAAGKLCQKVNWNKSQHPRYLYNCARIQAALGDFTAALTLTDLFIKRAGQSVPKEASELREAIGRKRGKFEPAEADF